MKKSFDNNEALNEIFGGFKSVEEIEKEKELQKENQKKEVKEKSDNSDTIKKAKKNQPEKRMTLFTDIDEVVAEYLDLMTFITGQTKKEYINSIIKEDIRRTLNVAEGSTDTQIHRAIENKKKELQKLFRKPSM